MSKQAEQLIREANESAERHKRKREDLIDNIGQALISALHNTMHEVHERQPEDVTLPIAICENVLAGVLVCMAGYLEAHAFTREETGHFFRARFDQALKAFKEADRK